MRKAPATESRWQWRAKSLHMRRRQGSKLGLMRRMHFGREIAACVQPSNRQACLVATELLYLTIKIEINDHPLHQHEPIRRFFGDGNS